MNLSRPATAASPRSAAPASPPPSPHRTAPRTKWTVSPGVWVSGGGKREGEGGTGRDGASLAGSRPPCRRAGGEHLRPVGGGGPAGWGCAERGGRRGPARGGGGDAGPGRANTARAVAGAEGRERREGMPARNLVSFKPSVARGSGCTCLLCSSLAAGLRCPRVSCLGWGCRWGF